MQLHTLLVETKDRMCVSQSGGGVDGAHAIDAICGRRCVGMIVVG